MLRSGCDTLSVKEQARHSSLLMTDIYTPHDIQEANPLLLRYQGYYKKRLPNFTIEQAD